MADTGRQRRVGPGGIPPSAASVRSPPRYLPQQQQQHRFAPQRTPKTPPVNSKMGIKSGMTVEDLKRLTQQRMQQTNGADARTQRPATPTAAQLPVPTPTLNVAAVHAHAAPAAVPTPTSLAPKAGMSVQELKQLTSLRLASQNVPRHQSEITGLVSKAVLSNAAKSHYRDSLRGSLTPSTTPKRTSMQDVVTTPVRCAPEGVSSPTMDDHMMGGRHSLPSRPMGIPSMQRGDLDHMQRSSDFGLHSVNQMRYSYSGPDDYYGFDASGSDGSDDNNDYSRPSLNLDDEAKYGFDEFNPARPFAEDSFPPPPPLDDTGRFVATSLPSWSPPPVRSKKLDAAPQPLSFYSQPSYFAQQQQADTSRDQNAVIAPPPGLTRRPSMTVPWQVAEAVLNTPQTTTGRKTVMSPTNSTDSRGDAITSNMFAVPTKDRGANLKSPAAELAAEMSAIALGRQRSGSGAPPPAPNVTLPAMLGTSPPGNGSAGARRGSFGNAAEFFKFRRRSKSRLELARDIASSYSSDTGGFPNYGATGTSAPTGNGKSMPGIDESRADFRDNFSVVANADTNSITSHDESVPSPGNPNVDNDYEDSEGGGSFVSFYNAAGVGRHREGFGSNLSNLSIPPPPPPPLTDDEDEGSTTSSTKGLPMMSPNGVRLRKVAELARRGSLSSEDKTRVKDEIIQNSLGIGASNAARILTAKPTNGTPIPGPSPAPASPPPGFQRLPSATPPRDTPKATATKSIPSGIVRNTPTTGIVARSPPKYASSMMSPTSVGGAARKTLSPQKTSNSRTLEERLAAAAQRVADCAGKGDMVGFQSAMEELDVLRAEANAMLQRS